MKKEKSLRGKLIKDVIKSMCSTEITKSWPISDAIIKAELTRHLKFYTQVIMHPESDLEFFAGQIYFLDETDTERCIDLTITKWSKFKK